MIHVKRYILVDEQLKVHASMITVLQKFVYYKKLLHMFLC